MRMYRIQTGLISIVLVATGALFAGGAATAAEEDARALPKREISSNIKNTGDKLIFKGNVSPGHAEKKVIIQKKNCKSDECSWYGWKTVTTNEKGGFSQRVQAPDKGSWFWRAKVKAYGGYGTSYSSAWRTYSV